LGFFDELRNANGLAIGTRLLSQLKYGYFDMNEELLEIQKKICDAHRVLPVPSDMTQTIAIAANMSEDLFPINGMRINPNRIFSGWFFWAGEEYSEDASFFKPVCIAHMATIDIKVFKYLSLLPGFRVLYAEDYEDIWYDPELLKPREFD
jgi:hypothetical protein